MANLTELMRMWIESIIRQLGYPGLSLLMLVENLFPPIPSEPILVFSGLLAATGELSFLGVLFFSTLGSASGAFLLYYLGLKTGERLLRAFLRRYGVYMLLGESDLDAATKNFNRFGPIYVFLARLMPVMRSLISIPAGVSKMPLAKFAAFTLIGTGLWNSFLIYSGMVLGAQWENILRVIDQYETVLLVLLTLLVVARLVVFWVNRRRSLMTGQAIKLELSQRFDDSPITEPAGDPIRAPYRVDEP